MPPTPKFGSARDDLKSKYCSGWKLAQAGIRFGSADQDEIRGLRIVPVSNDRRA